MTTPDLSSLVPSKWKTWVALIGAVLTFVVPLVTSVEEYLPSPWPAVIGAVLAVLTALGVYKAPYVPPTAVLVPSPEVGTATINVTTNAGEVAREVDQRIQQQQAYRNPWQ